jgi:transposase-like protein
MAALVDQGYSYVVIARRMKVPERTAKNWVSLYRRQGIEGLVPMTTNKKYPAALKVEAVQAFLGGMTKDQVMARFGIRNKTQLELWVRRYRELGAEGLAERPRGRRPRSPGAGETMEQKVQRLEMENAALKKLHALAAEERRRESK